MINKQIWIRISFVLMLAVLITLPLEPSDVLARGGSPQDHGRRPSDDDVSIKKGELFGDLWLILRDVGADKDGAPIKCTWTWPESAYNTDGELEIKHGDVPSGYSCSADDDGFLQPYSFEQIPKDPEESEFLSFESTIVDSYGNDITVYLIPLDDEGKVPEVYETLWGEKIVEADLGRYNVARSTQYVLDAAFDEAIRTLDGGEIGLDPAGRLKSTFDDGSVKTVESPLQNIALYQKLMLNGFLTTTSELEFPDDLKYLNPDPVDDTEDTPTLDADDLLRAASFLGGGADKFCRLNVDMLVYVNTLLGVNKVVTESDDVGNETIYIKSYFDFPADFKYDRFSVDREDAILLQPSDSDDTTYTVKDPVVINGATGEDSPVFVGNWDGAVSADQYPIINFLRAADDALTVVFYTHNFQVPAEFTRVD